LRAVAVAVAVALGVAAGCGGSQEVTTGETAVTQAVPGITVQASDSTPPELTLAVQEIGGGDAVNAPKEAGDPSAPLKIQSKSSTLRFALFATDKESGIQALEILVNWSSTSCPAETPDMCRTDQPLTGPFFRTTYPKVKPGQTTPERALVFQDAPLSTWISQGPPAQGPGSYSVEITSRLRHEPSWR
jgi:hypothetical protein